MIAWALPAEPVHHVGVEAEGQELLRHGHDGLDGLIPGTRNVSPVGVAGDVAFQLGFRLGPGAGHVGGAAFGAQGVKLGRGVAPGIFVALHAWLSAGK